MTIAQAAPKISYDHGVSTRKLMARPSAPFSTGPSRPIATAKRWWCAIRNVRWSWGELGRRVDDLASGLLTLGLERGDRVGIWAPNRYEWTLAQFATAKAGLVAVTSIRPTGRAELEYA